MKTFFIPDVLLNKIGTEISTDNGTFIITGVRPVGKKWKVWGIEKSDDKDFTKNIPEWHYANIAQSRGNFAFYPGIPIGFFELIPEHDR